MPISKVASSVQSNQLISQSICKKSIMNDAKAIEHIKNEK